MKSNHHTSTPLSAPANDTLAERAIRRAEKKAERLNQPKNRQKRNVKPTAVMEYPFLKNLKGLNKK